MQQSYPPGAESRLDKNRQKLYATRAGEKYRALNESERIHHRLAGTHKASCSETIRAMLHENATIEVSHQTVARYCREVLDAARAKKPRRPKTPTTEAPASVQEQLAARQPLSPATATRTAHH